MVSLSFDRRFPDLVDLIRSNDDSRLIELYTRAMFPDLPVPGFYAFNPRPDTPAEYDEQTAFIEDRDSKFAILLGGTGAGKTQAAAYKTARYLQETRPFVERCPFWVMGSNFEQICQVAWTEKLSKMIPASEIIDIAWYNAKRQWPRAVMLKHPDPDRRDRAGWIIEFRSYEQGIKAVKGTSVGGYWLNEEVPFEQIAEIQGRTREFDSPGWADFTPVECKDVAWPDAYEHPPEGWKFYHVNTEKNTALAPEWVTRYLASIPEDVRETRRIGTFTQLHGAVYKEFRKFIHVIDWDGFYDITGHRTIPRDWRKIRGMDFGYNNPTCMLWIARDHDQRYYIYDEHYGSQNTPDWHAEKINARGEWPQDPWHGPTYTDHDASWRAILMKLLRMERRMDDAKI